MKKLICKVHNDKDGIILSCKIVENVHTKETDIIRSKEKIIKDIEDENQEYFTALWEYIEYIKLGKYSKSGKQLEYVKKAKISVVDREYLRSDNNNISKDNLDELPTF